jgi:hypothetical protein
MLRYFHAIESKNIVPEREWKFGYFGQHHVLLLPADEVVELFAREHPIEGDFPSSIDDYFGGDGRTVPDIR